MIIEFPISREMRALQYERSRKSLAQCRDFYGDAFPMMFPAARVFDRTKWIVPAPQQPVVRPPSPWTEQTFKL
jgi:hypothetical protein